METGDIESFLNSAEPVEVTDDVEAVTPEPTPEPTQPRDESGRFAPKGDNTPTEEPSASPAPEKPTEPSLDHPALIGERRRRQEAEDRLRAYEQQFAQQQAPTQPQTTSTAAPDRWEDPEGHDQFVIAQAEQRAVAAAEQRFFERHLDMSEAAARERHPDFNDKLAVFKDLMDANPLLVQRMRSHPDPAGFAYTTAAKAMEVEQYGSIDQMVAAKVAEALAAAQPAPITPVPVVPTSLADQQSARPLGHSPAGPPTLAQILGR